MNHSVVSAFINASTAAATSAAVSFSPLHPEGFTPRLLGTPHSEAYTGKEVLFDAGRIAGGGRQQIAPSDGFGNYGGDLSSGMEVGVESLTQATIILIVGVAIIISNIIVLATFLTMPGK